MSLPPTTYEGCSILTLAKASQGKSHPFCFLMQKNTISLAAARLPAVLLYFVVFFSGLKRQLSALLKMLYIDAEACNNFTEQLHSERARAPCDTGGPSDAAIVMSYFIRVWMSWQEAAKSIQRDRRQDLKINKLYLIDGAIMLWRAEERWRGGCDGVFHRMDDLITVWRSSRNPHESQQTENISTRFMFFFFF